jgi:ribosome recycling factor
MDQFIKDFEAKIKGLFESLKEELIGIRTGRPHPMLVSNVMVDYGGMQMSIKQLASIGVNPPREIVLSVWDLGAVPSVAKALEMSLIGGTVSIDGATVRLMLPPLSDERRKEFSKTAKSLTEERRIKIRSLRDDINKRLERMKKDGEITEDMNFKGKKKIQDIVDRVGKDIEVQLAQKIKEIES